MARTLIKADMLERVPAIPATPYIPGHRNVIRTWPPGSSSYAEISEVIGDWNGGSVRGDILDDGTIIAYTVIPAVAATPGVPAYTVDHGVAEWNSGGSSVLPLDGDGAFRFQTGNSPGGVIVGLVATNRSVLPSEAAHAIYVAGSAAKVVELGVVAYTFPVAVNGDTLYVIRRTAGEVTYSAGSEQYGSLVSSDSSKVYLDASLFLSGDSVDNPELLEGSSGLSFAEIDGSLPALVGYVSTQPPNYINAKLPRLTGAVYSAPFGTYGVVDGSLPPLSGLLIGVRGGVIEIDGDLPRLIGIVTEHAHSFIDATLPRLTGYATTASEAGRYTARSSLEMGDWFVGVARRSATVNVSLRLGSRFKGAQRRYGSVYDGLLYGDYVASQQTLYARITCGLGLGAGLGSKTAGDLSAFAAAARAPTQYAVNTKTAAVSTYDGFAFNAFARAGQRTYGARKDGVYRLRAGDDAGKSRVVAVDFGVIPLGADASRVVECVYLGLRTDGVVHVRMTSGEMDYSYPARECKGLLRAVMGKGAKDRLWNVALEVEDATYLNLDLVELYVTENRRRWARG